jgi:AcrR family transcriptional regulator
MQKPKPSRRPGPPKAFDADTALKAVMFVFWREGFDGASLSDLTRAMGINRPSLDATCGDKESLFGRGASRQDLYRVVDLALAFRPQPNAKARRRKPAAPAAEVDPSRPARQRWRTRE